MCFVWQVVWHVSMARSMARGMDDIYLAGDESATVDMGLVNEAQLSRHLCVVLFGSEVGLVVVLERVQTETKTAGNGAGRRHR